MKRQDACRGGGFRSAFADEGIPGPRRWNLNPQVWNPNRDEAFFAATHWCVFGDDVFFPILRRKLTTRPHASGWNGSWRF